MTPEGKTLARIVAYLKSLGPECWWVKLHGGPMQRAGLPDLLIVYRGQALFVEVKSQSGKTTPLQDAMHRRIAGAGGRVLVARDVDTVRGELAGNPAV